MVDFPASDVWLPEGIHPPTNHLFATWHILAHVLGLQRNTWHFFYSHRCWERPCHQQVDPVRASAARSLDAKTLPPRNPSEACSSTRVDLAREVNQVIGYNIYILYIYIGYSWLFKAPCIPVCGHLLSTSAFHLPLPSLVLILLDCKHATEKNRTFPQRGRWP